jgi:hypothetical protein
MKLIATQRLMECEVHNEFDRLNLSQTRGTNRVCAIYCVLVRALKWFSHM